jgi:pectate lyase
VAGQGGAGGSGGAAGAGQGGAGGSGGARVFFDDFESGNWLWQPEDTVDWWFGSYQGNHFLTTLNDEPRQVHAWAGDSAWTDQVIDFRYQEMGSDSTSDYFFVGGRIQHVVEDEQTRIGGYGRRVSGGPAGSIRLVRFNAATGTFTGLDAAEKPSVGTWHSMRLEIIGTRLNGYLNGSLVVSADDSTYAAGHIQISQYLFFEVNLDDVAVYEP